MGYFNLIDFGPVMITELVAAMREKHVVPNGFATFFPERTIRRQDFKIQVQRNGKRMAVDVARNSEANRIEWTRSTDKLFSPPSLKEKFDITKFDGFDRVTVPGVQAQEGDLANIARKTQESVADILDAYKRFRLKMCADIMQYGIATFKMHDAIDFRRKAASMVTKTGSATWNNTTTADPIKDITDAGVFLRDVGNTSSGVLNVICGDVAMANFMANDKVIKQGDLKRIDRLELNMPVADPSSGFTLHGRFAAGDFLCYLWTYNDTYDTYVSGVKTKKRYLESNNVVVLPDDFQGETILSALPSLTNGGAMITFTEANYTITPFVDPEKMAWWLTVEQRPTAIAETVDLMYTIKTQ